MCVCVHKVCEDMSFGCDYVKYVSWIKIKETEPWYKKELLKTATYNVWQTAYGRIYCNWFSPTCTRYTEIEGERKSPENGYELDRLSDTAPCNDKVGSLSKMLPVFYSSPWPLQNFFDRKRLDSVAAVRLSVQRSFTSTCCCLEFDDSDFFIEMWKRKTAQAPVCVCRRVCLAELASTPGLASRLYHMVTFIMYLAIH